MIGTPALAKIIASFDLHLREDEDEMLSDDVLTDLPGGWVYIASGASRHAFLGPDGCVYKVHTAYGVKMGSDSNRLQFSTWLDMKQTSLRLAECSYHAESNVLAQEWVDGDVDEWSAHEWDLYATAMALGFTLDIHCENYRLVDGEPVLIDW